MVALAPLPVKVVGVEVVDIGEVEANPAVVRMEVEVEVGHPPQVATDPTVGSSQSLLYLLVDSTSINLESVGYSYNYGLRKQSLCPGVKHMPKLVILLLGMTWPA
jgi:hypothetical protein